MKLRDLLQGLEVIKTNADLDQQITLTVSNGTDDLTVTYGPLNYIVRMNEKGSENLQALVLAMYNYYLVAEAYSIDN